MNITIQNIKRRWEMSKKKKQSEYEKEIDSRSSFPTQEELILSLMIEQETFRDLMAEEDIGDFQDNISREIALEVYMKTKGKEQIKPSALLNLLSSNARETLSKIMAKGFRYNDPQQALVRWRQENIKRKMKDGKLTLNEQQAQIEKLKSFKN